MEQSRVLDVQDFVNARADELEALLQHVKTWRGAGNFGAPALSRHLRRRATSHNRYFTRRRPNAKLPRLDLGTSSSGLPVSNAAGQLGERPTNRAMRRRPDRLALRAIACPQRQPGGPSEQADQAMQQGEAGGHPGSGFIPAGGESSERLETGPWHARRMKMDRRWGLRLAAGAVGRGHGSRSFLHNVRNGLAMHDASYHTCLSLRGHQRELAKCLAALSDRGHLQQQLLRAEVMCGAAEWSLMLHTPSSFPAAAICPARALFIPCTTASTPGSHDGGSGASDAWWYPDCTLWLWVHTSALADAGSALQRACEQCGLGTPQQLSLKRIELVGPKSDAALAAFLQPICPPLSQAGTEGSGGAVASGQLPMDVDTGCGSAGDPQAADSSLGARLWMAMSGQAGATGAMLRRRQLSWPHGCTLGLRVLDPRMAGPLRLGGASVAVPGLPLAVKPLSESEVHSQLRAWPEQGDWTAAAAQLLDSCRVAPAAATAPVPGPCSDARIGELRQAARAAVASMHPAALAQAAQSIAATLTTPSFGPGAQGAGPLAGSAPAPQSGAPAGEAPQQGAGSLPLLLVRRQMSPRSACSAVGWSLIVPQGWVMPLWTALSFQGARVAGQVEWRWVSALLHQPCFPYDFPHTCAGQQWAHEQRRRHREAAALRPAGRARRPLELAAAVPWGLGVGISAGEAAAQLDRAVRSKPDGSAVDGRYEWGSSHVLMRYPASAAAVSAGSTSAQVVAREEPSGLARGGHGEGGAGEAVEVTRVERKARKLLERALRARENAAGSQAAAAASQGHTGGGGKTGEQQMVPAARGQGSVAAGGSGQELAYARVRIVGRGRCQEGAAVLAVRPTPGPPLDQPQAQAGSNPRTPAPESLTVVGYVTSAFPRGVPGAYPGGLALCEARMLARGAQRHDKMQVWVHNPGSDANRQAVLLPVDLAGGTGSL